MFVEVLANVPDGHVVMQVVPLKYFSPEQLKHEELDEFEHVSQSEWQGSHVFVEVFSKTLVAKHEVGHVVPSRYLPVGQEEH